MTIDVGQQQEIARQIGPANLMAISGGRIRGIDNGIELPVGCGYTVRVELIADEYTVSRIFKRGDKEFVHGQRSRVYCDEISEVAYYASCFRSYGADRWPTK
jgi:hypothetical protein